MKKNLLFVLGLFILSASNAQKPEFVIPTGHSLMVNSVAFSPDGKYIVSGSEDKTCKLWDVSSGKEIKTFEGHSLPVTSVAFSPDGKYIVSGSKDKTCKLWDVITGKEIKTFEGHSDKVNSVAFAPDGKYIVSGSSDKTCKLWDLNTGKEIKVLEGNEFTSDFRSVAFSSDGKYIVSADINSIGIWDVNSETEIKNIFEYGTSFFSVALSPDGKYIVSGNPTPEKICKLWDVNTGKEIKTFEGHTKWITSVAFSPDGKYIVSGSWDKTCKLWDVNTGKEIKTFEGHSHKVKSVAFSPDGKYIVSGSEDKTCKLWDVNTGKEVKTFSSKANYITFLQQKNDLFISNGRTLSTIDINTLMIKDIRISEGIHFDLEFENYLFRLSNDSLLYFDSNLKLISKNKMQGRYRLGGKSKSTLKYINYDGNNHNLYATCILTGKTNVLKGHSGYVDKVVFSPDGNILASISGFTQDKLKLWDLSTNNEIRIRNNHSERVNAVAFSYDGKYIVSGSSDNTCKLWDVKRRKLLRIFKGHSLVASVAFSPDSKYIVSGSMACKLWDVNTGKEIKTFEGHSGLVFFVAFSPDGKYIISRDSQRITKLWDVNTGKEIKSFANSSYRDSEWWADDFSIFFVNTGNSVIVFNPNEKKEVNKFENTNFTKITYSEDKKYIFATNGFFLKLIDAVTYQEIITYYSIGESGYVVITPEGRFDASADAMGELYYVLGLNVIPLESLMEHFYTPNLWQLALAGEKFEELDVKIDNIILPPLVKISNPKDKSTQTKEQITISVQVTDQGGGIDEIRLYHNGKLIDGTQRGFKPVARDGATETKTFTVALVNGENRIRATAFNTQRTESIPHEIVLHYKAPEIVKPNLYILAIGINKYENSRYDLNFAVKDAQVFTSTLENVGKGIFDKVHKSVIIDAACTKNSIMAEIEKIKKNIKAEDVFVFYYAGHGVMSTGSAQERPDFFLVLHDITRMYEADNLLKEKGISSQEIMQFSKEIRAQKQLFVIDACQSGGAVQTLAMRGASEEKAIAQLARSTGTYFIASSGTEQDATEVASLGHGIFTYSVIKSLEGECKSNDKNITVNLLKSCIEQMVPELSKKHKGTTQYPTGYGFGQDFPIGVVK